MTTDRGMFGEVKGAAGRCGASRCLDCVDVDALLAANLSRAAETHTPRVLLALGVGTPRGPKGIDIRCIILKTMIGGALCDL